MYYEKYFFLITDDVICLWSIGQHLIRIGFLGLLSHLTHLVKLQELSRKRLLKQTNYKRQVIQRKIRHICLKSRSSPKFFYRKNNIADKRVSLQIFLTMYQQTKIDETAYFLYVKFPVWVAFRQTKDLNHKIQIYFFPLKSKIKFSIFLLYYFSIFLSFKNKFFNLAKKPVSN